MEDLRRRMFLLPLVLAVLVVLSPAWRAQARPRHCPASATAESASRSFLRAARRGTPAAFFRAMRRHVDMRGVAMFALGRHRRKLRRSQSGRFVTLSARYVARKLAAHARGYGGGAVEVVGCRRDVVETRLRPGGQRILWRFRGRRIVDVNIGDMWLAQLLREHYAGLIRRAGGDMNRFLAALR